MTSVTTPILVCKLEDIPDRQMRCFRLQEKDVLVVRDGERIFAMQNRCGHAGAPLHRGDFTEGLVVCPLHGAAFHIDTGAIEWPAILPPPLSEYIHSENPRLRKFGELLEAIETLPIAVYPVEVRGGNVYVTL